MDWILLVVILLVAGVVLAAFALLLKRLKGLEQKLGPSEGVMLLNQNVQGMQTRLDTINEGINTRLDKAASVIGAMNKELGTMSEIGRGMKDLQDFLRSPKLRGNIGEQIMHDLLSQHFPRQYFEVQYKFKNGQTVDALLKTDQGFISIDSKFPMENFIRAAKSATEEEHAGHLREFKKDVKKHITDISKKYILPEEGTVDFALMYIPSEAVYYEIIRDDTDLNQFAQEKKVLLVSPNSFFYFLKVLLIGLAGKKMEENARNIFQVLQAAQKDMTRFGDDLAVLARHMKNAGGMLEQVQLDHQKLSSTMDQVHLLKQGD
ncbi:MAG: DNA recombination protein RmuC [Patescibacteria group bacterium]